jgi:hypothetical protein
MNILCAGEGEASVIKIVPSKNIEGAMLIFVLLVLFVGVN